MISKQDEKILRNMLSLAVEPDEALTFHEMCGFLFGIAITPSFIPPSEWLPRIFGEEMITVDSEDEGNDLLSSLFQVLNKLSNHFHNADIRFPYEKNYLAREDDIVTVQEWVYGLNEGLSLRPDCWLEMCPDSIPEDEVDEYEEDQMSALGVVQGIADPDVAQEIFDARFDETEDTSMELQARLYSILPAAVGTILAHAHDLEQERHQCLQNRPSVPHTFRHKAPKIGRNDPCPCGSDKKYKKCCMRKEKVVPIRQ